MSRSALLGFLRAPRYEVLPTEEVEGLVLAHVPKEVTVTITASPRRGMDATIRLAEHLAGHGYSVVPHLSARLIRDESHLKEILAAVEDSQLEGRLQSKEEAMTFVGQHFPLEAR